VKLKSTLFAARVRVSLYCILAMAFIIALLGLFVEPTSANESINKDLIYSEVSKNETIEGTQMDPVAPVYQRSDVFGSEFVPRGDGRICYVTLSYGESLPAITPDNTIAIPISLCSEIALIVMRQYIDDLDFTE